MLDVLEVVFYCIEVIFRFLLNKSRLEISIEDSGLKGVGTIPLCSLGEESRGVQPGVPKDFLWDAERRRGGSSCPLPRLPQLGET